jgi:hypothetical protein
MVKGPIGVAYVKTPSASSQQVICDFTTGKARPFFNTSFRWTAFTSLLSLSHPGAQASARLMSRTFVWPSKKKDVNLWSRSSEIFQLCKVTHYVSPPLVQLPMSAARFVVLNFDLVGPYHCPGAIATAAQLLTDFFAGARPSPSRSIRVTIPPASSGFSFKKLA